jgi:hypothetical protein
MGAVEPGISKIVLAGLDLGNFLTSGGKRLKIGSHAHSWAGTGAFHRFPVGAGET